MITIETMAEASRYRLTSQGALTLQLKRWHHLLDELRDSPKYGFVLDFLEHLPLSPEKLYNFFDAWDIWRRFEKAADILERHGVKTTIDDQGWTTLEDDFSRWFARREAASGWSFAFNRQIRAFRLTTTVARENKTPLDLKIECCLGAKSVQPDVKVLAKESSLANFDDSSVPQLIDRRQRNLALSVANSLLHLFKVQYED